MLKIKLNFSLSNKVVKKIILPFFSKFLSEILFLIIINLYLLFLEYIFILFFLIKLIYLFGILHDILYNFLIFSIYF